MVAGHLRVQNGYWQMILSYRDSTGKRRTKSVSTHLKEKGNKRRAEAMLLDLRRAFTKERQHDLQNGWGNPKFCVTAKTGANIKRGMMSNLRSKIGALLVKPALKATLKDFDSSEYGGAPLLGLKGLVVKTHGSSTSKEVCNSIIQCVTFKEQKINEKIKAAIQKTQEEERESE